MEFLQFMIKLIAAVGHSILRLLKKLKSFFTRVFTVIKQKRRQKKDNIWVPNYVNAKRHRSAVKGIIYTFVVFMSGILFAVIFLLIPSHVHLWFKELPNPDLLVTREVTSPTKILDRKGRLLYEIFVDRKYEPVNLDRIPEHMVQATVAVEDDQFFNHIGFDIKSTLRAAKSTLFEDKLQGGSTITQQLVKNVLLTSERTVTRKIKELVLSILVETKYSKEEILELYLNNISYGGNAWGAQSAAQKFFGKNVWELNLAECALLAGLPSAPSTYSPLSGDTTLVKSRQKHVLDRMYQLGYITNKEAIQAYDQTLDFVEQTEYIRAPHFVALIRNELETLYGRRFVENGGLTVRTTLDLDLQDKVQSIVKEEVEKSGHLLISNGASVVLDSQNAEVLAYVGSIDYFKEIWGSYDVASAYRQPGSSIKPVTYALALENGYTLASAIKDKPITYRIEGSPSYTPKNYDGKYHGDVTLRAALANSYNIPAVRMASSLGPDNIVTLGKEMGLSNWNVDGSYGLSVTLGGKEVRLIDHTNLFATFARGGMYKPTRLFLNVTDRNGYDISKNDSSLQKRVLSEEISYLIWHVLSDNNARIPAFGTRNSLVIPNKKVAVKTGTTDEIRDNLTMGFTPSFTVGVWVGNNDNSPLHKNLASGLSGAAPIWNRIMSLALADKEDEPMIQPEGVFSKYDKECNTTEFFVKGSKVPERLCLTDKDDDKKDD